MLQLYSHGNEYFCIQPIQVLLLRTIWKKSGIYTHRFIYNLNFHLSVQQWTPDRNYVNTHQLPAYWYKSAILKCVNHTAQDIGWILGSVNHSLDNLFWSVPDKITNPVMYFIIGHSLHTKGIMFSTLQSKNLRIKRIGSGFDIRNIS